MDRRPSHASPPAYTLQTSPAAEEPAEKDALDGITQPLEATRPDELAEVRQQKVTHIRRACKDGDIPALVDLAASRGGFLDDELRCSAWPILLGCNETAVYDNAVDWRILPAHRDEEQVQLDVNRSFVYYPDDETEQQLRLRKQDLSDLIVEVLRRHPALYYFQGYHDIVQVLLLVLGRTSSTEATIRLSLLRIRDFMLPAMSPALAHLRLLPSILYAANRGLYERVAPTQPFFALAATLTLYAHDIQEYGDIARLFDFLLAGETVLPVYFYAAVILDREKELLEVPQDEPEMLHFTLSKLPQPLDIERYIAATRRLMVQHPPQSLSPWKWISSASVLKTTRDPEALARQSIEDGERLFEQQAKNLRRQQILERAVKGARLRLWMYRKPALVMTAVAVGALALWLGNRPYLRYRLW